MMEEQSPAPPELLRRAARDEQRLLRREARAERGLATAVEALKRAEGRLRRARDRVADRRQAVDAAEATLRQRQAERAIGPTWVAGVSSPHSEAGQPAEMLSDASPLPAATTVDEKTDAPRRRRPRTSGAEGAPPRS